MDEHSVDVEKMLLLWAFLKMSHGYSTSYMKGLDAVDRRTIFSRQ